MQHHHTAAEMTVVMQTRPAGVIRMVHVELNPPPSTRAIGVYSVTYPLIT